MAVHAAAVFWVAPSWSCPGVCLRQSKKIFVGFVLIAFTKIFEADEDLSVFSRQILGEPHEGALLEKFIS